MKNTVSFFLCITILFVCLTAVSAAEQENVIYYRELDLGNGITLIDEIIEHPTTARATAKTSTRRNTLKDGDTVIGIIAFQATFHYDGTTVYVASKSITQTDTYDGWSYKQNSFTSSGGTVTLDAKLTKLLFLNVPFTMNLACDKNGNITF